MAALEPNSFLEAIGGLFALLSVLFLFLSLKATLRVHAMKLFAILLILSIAFIANHWAIYFSAVFIIATAATELEFLQNLAAIVRGSKDYFSYRKHLIKTADFEGRTPTEKNYPDGREPKK